MFITFISFAGQVYYSKKHWNHLSIQSYLVTFLGLLNSMTWNLLRLLRMKTKNVQKGPVTSLITILTPANVTVLGKVIVFSHFIGMRSYTISAHSLKNRSSCFLYFDALSITSQGKSMELTASTIKISLNRFIKSFTSKYPN